MMHRDSKKDTRLTIVLLSLIVLFLAICAFFVIAFYQSTRPIEQAKSEAIEIAKSHGNVKSVEQFYQYSRKSTSYTVLGKTNDEKEVIVLIPKSGKNIQTINQSEGLTEKQAMQTVIQENNNETFVEASLGLEKTKPTWEIVTKSTSGDYNYYLVDFKEGKIVKSIKAA